jgi:hypothetical protein
LCRATGASTRSVCAAEYCSLGATQAPCDSVLLVYADDAHPYVSDVQQKLEDTGSFTTVDTFDAQIGTPSASQLAGYTAVLLFSWKSYGFNDAVLLGDRLAAYHDQGGGVVIALFANSESRLKGVYGTATNGYTLLDYAQGSQTFQADSLGDVLEPHSPLLIGFNSFAATEASRSTAPVISGRGVVVARWSGGGQEPLVVRGARGVRTLVELNFYPPSSSASSSYWTGNGVALLRNALKYSRCILESPMLCGPGLFQVSTQLQGRDIISIIFINTHRMRQH